MSESHRLVFVMGLFRQLKLTPVSVDLGVRCLESVRSSDGFHGHDTSCALK